MTTNTDQPTDDEIETIQILSTVEEIWPKIDELAPAVQMSILAMLVERWVALTVPRKAWSDLLNDFNRITNGGMEQTAKELTAEGEKLPTVSQFILKQERH